MLSYTESQFHFKLHQREHKRVRKKEEEEQTQWEIEEKQSTNKTEAWSLHKQTHTDIMGTSWKTDPRRPRGSLREIQLTDLYHLAG